MHPPPHPRSHPPSWPLFVSFDLVGKAASDKTRLFPSTCSLFSSSLCHNRFSVARTPKSRTLFCPNTERLFILIFILSFYLFLSRLGRLSVHMVLRIRQKLRSRKRRRAHVKNNNNNEIKQQQQQQNRCSSG